VIWLYAKGGGKNATHAWIAETNSIGELSYIVLQVYEQTLRAQFRAIPNTASFVFALKYTQLPASGFHCRLPHRPRLLPGATGHMELSGDSLDRFQRLIREIASLRKAVKSPSSNRRKGKANVGEEADE